MKDATLKDWIRTIIYSIIFTLFVVWVGNYWLLLGLPIVIDIYLTKFVPWDFYKKPKSGDKPSKFIEWADAIVFALVAVGLINIYLFQNYKIPTSSLEKSLLVGDHLFVSKVAYGPRNPITPLSFPLAQNRVRGVKSYITNPQWEYKRLKGFGKIKHDDIVVFNFPAGDTVALKMTNPDYYQLCDILGRDAVNNNSVPGRDLGKIVWRPVDRRDNYVKRCVALPGDEFEIKKGVVYVNGKAQKEIEGLQHNYFVHTKNSTRLNPKLFERLNIAKDDIQYGGGGYYLPLTEANVKELNAVSAVIGIKRDEKFPNQAEAHAFPRDKQYAWNRDFMGPFTIPAKGATVDLNLKTLPLYNRIIEAYEKNTLEVTDSAIYINGKTANSYTFKMDYYWMMGDNRHNSTDSRYWGFVPEDHVVGKPIVVWLSLDKDKGFPANIRWNRFFKMVHAD